jgi:hypothetical protein
MSRARGSGCTVVSWNPESLVRRGSQVRKATGCNPVMRGCNSRPRLSQWFLRPLRAGPLVLFLTTGIAPIFAPGRTSRWQTARRTSARPRSSGGTTAARFLSVHLQRQNAWLLTRMPQVRLLPREPHQLDGVSSSGRTAVSEAADQSSILCTPTPGPEAKREGTCLASRSTPVQLRPGPR